MTKKLEACPFCGSEDVQLVTTEQPWVVCKNCRAEININCNYDQQVVIDKWNTRHPSQATVGKDAVIADIIAVMKEIQEEINSRPQHSNVGKKGCWNRLSTIVDKHERFSPPPEARGMEVSVEELKVIAKKCAEEYFLRDNDAEELLYCIDDCGILEAIHAKLSAQPGRGK